MGLMLKLFQQISGVFSLPALRRFALAGLLADQARTLPLPGPGTSSRQDHSDPDQITQPARRPNLARPDHPDPVARPARRGLGRQAPEPGRAIRPRGTAVGLV